jgi:allantoicase
VRDRAGRPGTIEAVEVDTAHFKGNFPDRCSLQARDGAGGTPESLVTQSMFWPELLPEQKLQMDHQHHYRGQICCTAPSAMCASTSIRMAASRACVCAGTRRE